MILHPHGDGFVAITQSAHALAAFQLADHWGNRQTPRPAPRADVLAAVLLHDVGWNDREYSWRLDHEGKPLAFDTLPEEERETLWTANVERAAAHGRYVAYLVSHHVTVLAERYSRTPHRAFLDRESERRRSLCGDLAADACRAAALSGPADEVNRAIVRLADALSVHLCRGATGTTTVPDLPRRTGPVPLSLHRVAERTYRLDPWPLVGRRLEVHAEGRLLPARRFANADALELAWSQGRTVRLAWTLLAPGAPSD